eukprot:TRINITY_DN9357_c0_g1_i1.p1 TRINITY_DN9357_c0_g1~~TRINITY_DN9357_c0_g1_i1.p1  ORF type:complete len:339 (-),score=62.09 TRINITY_DN9357_c0_g1_i1:953-1909(-)
MAHPNQKLDAKTFACLGELAEAALEATLLCIERAERSGSQGRIPISGAAVTRSKAGALKIVTVGHNGRIPDPDSAEDHGYPTDHGETGAIRAIEEYDTVDWSATVFATSLSPCIMCTRMLEDLYSHGLRSLVIAEAKTFQGPTSRLDALPGMRIVRLEHAPLVSAMQTFQRRHPWDWAADVGEIPPKNPDIVAVLAVWRAFYTELLARCKDGHAAVIGPNGDTLAVARDDRSMRGGNPCFGSVIQAMGQAGSAVNLRECAVVWRPLRKHDMKSFGSTSLGACELFRPSALVVKGALEEDLANAFEAAGIAVISSEDDD